MWDLGHDELLQQKDNDERVQTDFGKPASCANTTELEFVGNFGVFCCCYCLVVVVVVAVVVSCVCECARARVRACVRACV